MPDAEVPDLEVPDIEPGVIPGVAPGQLSRVAAHFGLLPWDTTGPTPVPPLDVAIQHAAELWAAPRPAHMQKGINAVCGGRTPLSLIGVQLWPVLTQCESGPALVLADLGGRIHIVVDVALLPGSHPERPKWVAASGVALSPRMPGSHELWWHWRRELSAHAPHDWSTACDEHAHLDRPNAQGQLITAIPRHDAWVMCRSWLPPDFVIPATGDARWVVLGPSARPLRERDPLIRSRWDVVSFDEFGGVVAAQHTADTALLPALATVLRLMLPPTE